MLKENKKLLNIIITIFLLVIISSSIYAAESFKTEIVVFSAEPEGVAAAVAAAREGKEVILVMTREKPGGLMTYAALNFLDLNYDRNSNNINQGLFSEWHQKIGASISFSPQKAEAAFTEMLEGEQNIKIINSAELQEVQSKDNKIESIKVKKENNLYKLSAEIFIDASQDGDLAAAAEEDFFVGTADMNLKNSWMASTQILKFSEVEPEKLKKAVRNNRYQQSHFKDDHAWGFSNFGKSYQPRNQNLRLRGLNIVFIENDDSYEAYINALLLFNVDPLSESSILEAKNKAAEEAELILKYFQNKLAGFEKAELSDLPEELYRRESRHFLTEYQLKVKDLFRQKIFADSITIASYPLDYQAADHDYPGFVLFNPEYYAIPLRSLIARKNDNLMIVGRSSGYSSLAAASARVLPVGMNTAEAAAIAASEALNQDKKLLAITRDNQSLNKIRSQLNIDLEKYPSESPIIKEQKLLISLEKLLSWGITIGGYNNNFKLNIPPTEKEFTATILKIMQKKEAENLYEWVPGSLETLSSSQKLTTINALKLLLAAESQRVLEMESKEYFKKAKEMNLIPENLSTIFSKERIMTRKEMILLAAYYLDRFSAPSDLKYIRGEYFD
ncbi:FAD dependent oxidoreductase [Halanaerobium saccharolyticum]|uniref:FAD dependent oxidoreductase n=1 Tax=Halanaerobium saccharolyticum TaxID=43595 RepID=A0A4V3G643_9FIRM|nr:FAD-dependent oxidoreductase [Halanaerobium saccharolyticum]RAK11147.1 FAD dependent oxidoreductase [Halanaerobium saccharolyticum]TDW06998.1 FAD dependent oxidoreductase [Halanaerobium saccharolyticum]TDX63763.1 FAD dependent oxidoreductase [Halanaerobium saccharolyticum]